MKRILIAPDSFKGSLSAAEAAAAISRGLCQRFAHEKAPELICLPIADGGEGTLDALVPREKQTSVTVTGTNGKPVEAALGHIGDIAVIEMARAAGLTLVREQDRSVLTATTYGVGELIGHALDAGYRKFLLTAGGSGTNDGGCGMLSALGGTFLRKDGTALLPTAGTLREIAHIDLNRLDPRLDHCHFTVATDVKNPLLGPDGATYVYALQKGATAGVLPSMEAGMTHYASLLQQLCGRDVASIPGCGAGGGIAAPLLAFFDAAICSGIEAVLDAVHFDSLVRDADAVVTGEGKIDRQSLYGKAISGVASAAAKAGVPVYVLAGALGDDKSTLLQMGLANIRTLTELTNDATYSMTHAAELLEELASTLFL